MPAAKRRPSNAMLYSLIIFVSLFIITTTAAIIFYAKTEELRTTEADAQDRLKELASEKEVRNLPAIVGEKQRGKTRLGTMVDYLNQTASLVVGGGPTDDSAQAKVETADRKFDESLDLLAQAGYLDIDTLDPNAMGLVQIIEILKTDLDNSISKTAATQTLLDELQGRFDDTVEATFEKEQKLLAEKEEYQQQVTNIKKDYEDLKALMKETSEQQIQTLFSDLEKSRDDYEKEHQDKLKTEAELKRTKNRLDLVLEELQQVKPLPDIDVTAFRSDGKILLLDDATKTVHLNIGSENNVYRGLTFAVYDKSTPIPKDGKGKAEIEVLTVEKNISVAKILRSSIRRPILHGDTIANLIWDSEKTNVFTIAGEFDLDNDGKNDRDAAAKIKIRIEKWGGKVVDDVTIDTDFLILGKKPRTLPRPTFEEIEVYPMAMERYQTSVKKLSNYNEVIRQAQALSIPVLNYEKFLYLTGYKILSVRPGAF